MIAFGDSIYYLDLNKIDELIGNSDPSLKSQIIQEKEIIEKLDDGKLVVAEVITRDIHKGKEIDGAKFELISRMIDIIMSDLEDDNNLGPNSALQKKPLSYQLAFNTLIGCGVLKEL